MASKYGRISQTLSGQSEDPTPDDTSFRIVGTGNGRSVLCWRDIGATWLGKPMGESSANATQGIGD